MRAARARCPRAAHSIRPVTWPRGRGSRGRGGAGAAIGPRSGQEAAIGPQDLAGDPGGIGAGQQGHDGGDVLRLAEPLERGLGDLVLERLARVRGPQPFGLRGTRRHGVHRYPAPAELQRRHRRKVLQRALGAGIQCSARWMQPGVERGDGDDTAAVAQGPAGVLDDEERATAFPRASATSPTTRCAATSSAMKLNTTPAPSAARRFTIARPIPRDPPVTSAPWPANAPIPPPVPPGCASILPPPEKYLRL